jgi:hypothetical protein
MVFDHSIRRRDGTLKEQMKEKKTDDDTKEGGENAGSLEIEKKQKEDYGRGKKTVWAIHLLLDLERDQLDLSPYSEGERQYIEKVAPQYRQSDQGQWDDKADILHVEAQNVSLQVRARRVTELVEDHIHKDDYRQ